MGYSRATAYPFAISASTPRSLTTLSQVNCIRFSRHLGLNLGQLKTQTLHPCHDWTAIRHRSGSRSRTSWHPDRRSFDAGLILFTEKFTGTRKTIDSKPLFCEISCLHRRHNSDDPSHANHIHFDDVDQYLDQCGRLNGHWQSQILANRHSSRRRIDRHGFHLAVSKRNRVRQVRY